MRKLLLLCALLSPALSCTQPQPTQQTTAPETSAAANNTTGNASFKSAHDAYVREFLRRNPTVNTYLGGAGLDPSLREVDGRLRDHSAAALTAEDRWLSDAQKTFEAVSPASLSPNLRID
ncbi:MAG: hypothetical protein ACRD9R_23320, partial [Pyrinomonadaceae bacterium]